MPQDILALRYAILAADTLSFARAAAQAGVKQSTLSKRIANLEARLGLKLFERTTRGAVPTEAGLGFIDSARRLLGDLENLDVSGRAIGAGEAGTIGLGFSTSLASGNMRALIVDFGGRFPDLRINAVEGDRCRLTQSLHTRSVDFAVISGDVPDVGLKRRALWSERVMVVLPEAHGLGQKERIYWPDLRGERFVLPRLEPGLDLAELAKARLGEPGWRPDIAVQEVSRENIMNMVPFGRFVTLTTDTSLGHPPAGVLLRELRELSGHVSHIAYSGYWRSDNANPALQRLLGLMKDRYPD